MIRDDERRAALAVHLAAHARDTRVGREQVGRRDLAQRDDQLRLYQVDLPVEIGLALRSLARLGIAVPRRAALDDIRYVDLLAALQPDGHEHAVEEPAGLADEGFALRIFLRSRAFADEQPVRVLVPDPEHRLVAPGVEWAVVAAGHSRLQLGPLHAHDRAAAVAGCR